MGLNLGMMVDGNARSTFINVLNTLEMTPAEIVGREKEVTELYLQELPKTYIRNAKWCVRLGKELFSRTSNSEYTIFVYNVANRARGHFKSIENAIMDVGGELVQELGGFGEVCLVGPETEKSRWKAVYPRLKDVKETSKGHRTVILTGYQRDKGEDGGIAHIRPIDFFIRSTQMRFSGMILPCMDNTHFVVLNHIPYKYDPAELVQTLIDVKKMDEEHNELNIYSKFIYDLWAEHESKPPSIYVTTNAMPPKEYVFSQNPDIGADRGADRRPDKKIMPAADGK
jgi:hypothetical protein